MIEIGGNAQVRIIRGEAPLRVRTHRLPDGVDIVADGPAIPSTVRLRVRLPLRGVTTRWSMARGLPLGASRADVFERFLNQVHRARGEALREEVERQGFLGPLREEHSRTMRELRGLVRELAIHTADLCEPGARSLALRFPYCARVWLYGRVVRDGTGRIAQAAQVCPGLLLFLFALAEKRPFRPVVAQAKRAIVAGERLGRVLDIAVDGWMDVASQLASARSMQSDSAAALVAFGPDALGGRALADVKRKQRLLLRRAGPAVPPTLLFTPPPLAFAPEDIPERVRKNAVWFKTMKCRRLLLDARPDDDLPARIALASFLSKNAVQLAARPQRAERLGDEVGLLFDYVRAAGRRPGRATSVARLCAESDRWHGDVVDRAWRELDDPEASARSGGPPRHQTLPEAPVPRCDLAAGDWMEPLRTVGDLHEESRAMRHCVSSYVSRVVAGLTFIYRGVLRGRRVTVELVRDEYDNLRVEQALGYRNAPLAAGEQAELRDWLRAVRLHVLHGARWAPSEPQVDSVEPAVVQRTLPFLEVDTLGV